MSGFYIKHQVDIRNAFARIKHFRGLQRATTRWNGIISWRSSSCGCQCGLINFCERTCRPSWGGRSLKVWISPLRSPGLDPGGKHWLKRSGRLRHERKSALNRSRLTTSKNRPNGRPSAPLRICWTSAKPMSRYAGRKTSGRHWRWCVINTTYPCLIGSNPMIRRLPRTTR